MQCECVFENSIARFSNLIPGLSSILTCNSQSELLSLTNSTNLNRTCPSMPMPYWVYMAFGAIAVVCFLLGAITQCICNRLKATSQPVGRNGSEKKFNEDVSDAYLVPYVPPIPGQDGEQPYEMPSMRQSRDSLNSDIYEYMH